MAHIQLARTMIIITLYLKPSCSLGFSVSEPWITSTDYLVLFLYLSLHGLVQLTLTDVVS